jgi:hypothetical protein
MSLLPDLQFRSNIRQKAAGVQIKLLYHKREFSTTYTKLYPLTEQTYISLTDIMMRQCYPSRARSLKPQSMKGEHCWVRFHFSRWGIRSLLENSTVQSRGNRPVSEVHTTWLTHRPDGGSTHLRNVSLLLRDWTAPYPTRPSTLRTLLSVYYFMRLQISFNARGGGGAISSQNTLHSGNLL